MTTEQTKKRIEIQKLLEDMEQEDFSIFYKCCSAQDVALLTELAWIISFLNGSNTATSYMAAAESIKALKRLEHRRLEPIP